MLYRAIAYIHGSLDDSECVVFFQTPHDRSRSALLSSLLSQAWGMPESTIEIYNISSERELLDQAGGHATTGDARLFETGWGYGRACYADPSRTLMLVRPDTLRRLRGAQEASIAFDAERRAAEQLAGVTTVEPRREVSA